MYVWYIFLKKCLFYEYFNKTNQKLLIVFSFLTHVGLYKFLRYVKSVTIEMNGLQINPIDGACYSQSLGASRDFPGLFADSSVSFRKIQNFPAIIFSIQVTI